MNARAVGLWHCRWHRQGTPRRFPGPRREERGLSNKVALPRSDTAHHSRLSRYSPLAAIAFGIGGKDQGAQYRPRHNPLHLRQKRRPPCCPGVARKLTVANVSCLINPTRPRSVVLQCIIIRLLDTGLCRGSATARIQAMSEGYRVNNLAVFHSWWRPPQICSGAAREARSCLRGRRVTALRSQRDFSNKFRVIECVIMK